MKRAERSEAFSLMENLWKAKCKEMQWPPKHWSAENAGLAKATFFSGAMTALEAVAQGFEDPDRFPPEAVTRGLIDDCDRFFNDKLRELRRANN